MSIIERAMERLAGGNAEPAPTEGAAAAEVAPQAAASPPAEPVAPPAPTQPTDQPIAPPAAQAPTPPPAQAVPTTRAAPADVAARAKPTVESHGPGGRVRPPDRREAMATVSDEPGRGGTVHLAFDRLAAMGYLVPGQTADLKSEEFQQIKRRLLGNMVPGMLQTQMPTNLIMITSSLPGEGKTFTSVNLAISLAMEMDRTVLAVDTDIIKSDLTRLFGARDRLGLFDVLSRDDVEIPDVLLRTNIPKLTLLPAGRTQEVVTEKLASEAMRRLSMELATRYHDRVILFDCPPVLATTGAVALAPYVGQIVLVVEAGKTTQETVRHAMETMSHVNITGVVLNKSKQPAASSQYYGYGYYQQPNK